MPTLVNRPRNGRLLKQRIAHPGDAGHQVPSHAAASQCGTIVAQLHVAASLQNNPSQSREPVERVRVLVLEERNGNDAEL